jgi:hypothetical protein
MALPLLDQHRLRLRTDHVQRHQRRLAGAADRVISLTGRKLNGH